VPERVCVFIDGSNFYHLCRENLGGRTDVKFGDFATWLVGPSRSLVRTYYYNCRIAPDSAPAAKKAQESFLDVLYRTPYLEVRLGKLVRSPSGWTEKGIDMRIGIDMLMGAVRNLYDVAVLVSGDGDLAEAVRAVKSLGKHVEVASFQRGRSYELVQEADVYRPLELTSMRPFFTRP
jgi:uncharacterized LabA/DUF88 family protein